MQTDAHVLRQLQTQHRPTPASPADRRSLTCRQTLRATRPTTHVSSQFFVCLSRHWIECCNLSRSSQTSLPKSNTMQNPTRSPDPFSLASPSRNQTDQGSRQKLPTRYPTYISTSLGCPLTGSDQAPSGLESVEQAHLRRLVHVDLVVHDTLLFKYIHKSHNINDDDVNIHTPPTKQQ